MKKIDEKAKKCPYCQTDQRGWFSRHPILTVLLILFFSPFILISMISNASQNNKDANGNPVPTKQQELNASVNFTGTQFVITNNEKSDCEAAVIKVNDSFELDGYTLAAGHTYTVGAAQFTKGDGTRLDPFETKPLNFSIGCRGTNEMSQAFWYGEF